MKGNFSIKKNPLYTYLFVGCLLEPGIEIWQFFKNDFLFQIFGDFIFKKKIIESTTKNFKNLATEQNFCTQKKEKRKKRRVTRWKNPPPPQKKSDNWTPKSVIE
jgi:hypothetical protein